MLEDLRRDHHVVGASRFQVVHRTAHPLDVAALVALSRVGEGLLVHV